jgi:hypothetical protein
MVDWTLKTHVCQLTIPWPVCVAAAAVSLSRLTILISDIGDPLVSMRSNRPYLAVAGSLYLPRSRPLEPSLGYRNPGPVAVAVSSGLGCDDLQGKLSLFQFRHYLGRQIGANVIPGTEPSSHGGNSSLTRRL